MVDNIGKLISAYQLKLKADELEKFNRLSAEQKQAIVLAPINQSYEEKSKGLVVEMGNNPSIGITTDLTKAEATKNPFVLKTDSLSPIKNDKKVDNFQAADKNKTMNSYGHLPYKEADTSTLKVLHSNNAIKGSKEAVNSLDKMINEAQKDGVNIGVISGFRSVNQQTHLFYGIAKQRHQTLEKRAKTSAPPGFSEHHTGYAFDLSANSNPKTKLRTGFEQTAEFKWIEKNATKYGFELSFPKNNKQGVSYEPWHWRYVGNERSKEIFKTAREHQ